MELRSTYGVREYIRYVLPSTASMLVFSLYSMVDGIFVARGVGEEALAAVNLSMPFTNIVFAVAVLLSVGASTVVAIHIGRGELQKARATFTQNTIVVAVVAILISVLTQVFLEPIAIFLGATEPTLQYVKDYLGIVSAFAVCYMVSYSLEVMVKTDGHPTLSIIGVLACCVMNIVLDAVFVLGLDWGIKGAALATGIAQATSFTLFLCHFLSRRANIKPLFTKPFLSAYRRILPLGFADFAAEIALALTTLLFNRVILSLLGEGGVVSYAVVSYVNTLVLMLMTGVTQGMQPLVSLNHGRREPAHCRGYFGMGLGTVLGLGVVALAACWLSAPFITSLLLERGSGQFAYTVVALKHFSLSFLFAGINICTAGYFTAVEQPLKSMAISLGRGIVFVVLCMAALAAAFGGDGVWFTTAASETLCILLTLAFLLRKISKQN